jgi:tetratricopeptide (TPR) repeat protein
MSKTIPLLSLVALLLPAAPSWAQPSDDDVEEARRLFDEGNNAAREQDYPRALELFRQSYALNPNPPVLYNTALCYRNLDDAPAAVGALRRYIDDSGPSLVEERRTRAEQLIEELAPRVGFVRIAADDPDGSVLLDGELIGTTPFEDDLYVTPGAHTVVGRWEGFDPVERSIDVPAGVATPVAVRLLRPEPLITELPPPPPDGAEELLSPWYFWSMVGATGAFGVTLIFTGTFGELAYQDYVDGGKTDAALADKGQALDVATYVMAALTGAAFVAGTVLFFYTDFGGDEEEPAAVEPEVALLPGSLVLRW